MTLHQYIKTNYTNIPGGIQATITLLEDGATVPFIARYRKEVTGGLDEVDVADIKNGIKKYKELLSRKVTILESIGEQGKLTPDVRTKIENCWSITLLEDIYLPFKKKRKTRADKAKEAGLEGLAKIIMAQRETNIEFTAKKFSNRDLSQDEALLGARDIIAEWISENLTVRDIVRKNFTKYGIITSKVKKVKDDKKKELLKHYKDYWDYSSKLDRTPGHRLLAILRAENEGLISVSVNVEVDRLLEKIDRIYIKSRGDCANQIGMSIDDAYKRLIKPSIENEVLKVAKGKADIEAIEIFAKNLRQLLLEAPLGEIPILAIDPGFRTGCKVVILNSQGDLVANTTIFPHPPQNKYDESAKEIKTLIDKYSIKAVAIGNGTAGRETEAHVKGLGLEDLEVYLISEAGASIYSASQIAREEFPDLDLTIRGAISIGRRLKDPLAELIKIDPKSIGVGQYQHDVDQSQLKQSLEDVIVSCVNSVGVNLNTASHTLLSYISGVGPILAKRIVEYKSTIGHYKDRFQLKEVKGLGAKAFEQAAGFLRVKNGTNPLDDSGVHPERYRLVKKMATDAGTKIHDFIGNSDVVNRINLEHYKTSEVGLPTLRDIKNELMKPGVDPRGKAETFAFHPYLKTIEDVNVGMNLPGIIINVAKFGAFVDIGIKENGLIHISQITDKFISDPNEVLSVNQRIKAKVTNVDIERKRIQLSLK